MAGGAAMTLKFATDDKIAETSSKGNQEKVRRFQKEMAIFQRTWPEILRDGDPYYNPNFSMVTQDFSLKHN